MEIRLLLARHGETDWNAAGRVQGQSDTLLNARGRAQAKTLYIQLCKSGEEVHAIYSSPQKRAFETACIIGREFDLTPIVVEAFREISFGVWEGYSWEEIGARWPEEYAAYRRDRLAARPPRGESCEALLSRVLPSLNAIAASGEGAALVVCHSAVIKSVLCHRDGCSFQEINRRYALGNAQWVCVEGPL